MGPEPIQPAESVVLKAAHMVGGWHVEAADGPFCNWCMGAWPCPYRVLADYVLARHSDGEAPAQRGDER